MNEVADTDIERRTYTVGYRYEDPKDPWAQVDLVAHRTELAEELDGESGNETTTDFDTTGFDLRNTTRWDDDYASQAFTYGVEYYHDQQEATRNGAPRSSFPDADDDIYGFYLEDEITLAERLSVIPGFRYNHRRGLAFPRHPGRLPGQLLRPQSGLEARDHQHLGSGPAHAFRRSSGRVRPAAPPSRLFRYRRRGLHRSRGGYRRGDDPPRQYSGCRAQRFRDRARVRRLPLLRGHRLFGDAGQGCNDERATHVRPPGQARGDARPALPELGLVFTGRGRFVKRQDEVPAGVPVTPGYGVCDLYGSWLPEGAGYSGLRVDFGIDNLTGKLYRRHLSLIDEAGRNFKVSVSYRF